MPAPDPAIGVDSWAASHRRSGLGATDCFPRLIRSSQEISDSRVSVRLDFGLVGHGTSHSPPPSSPAQPFPLLTPDEVAAILGVPKATLYRWRYHREGPESIRIGRHLRYRASAIEAFIARREKDGRQVGAV